MRKFGIYKHPVLGLEAVKVGISWPAFFLPFIWMLIKLMWRRAAIWFGLSFIVLMVLEFTGQPESLGGKFLVVLLLLADIALWLAPALLGNRWRVDDLRALGYSHLVTLEAKSVTDALAQIRAEQCAAGHSHTARA